MFVVPSKNRCSGPWSAGAETPQPEPSESSVESLSGSAFASHAWSELQLLNQPCRSLGGKVAITPASTSYLHPFPFRLHSSTQFQLTRHCQAI